MQSLISEQRASYSYAHTSVLPPRLSFRVSRWVLSVMAAAMVLCVIECLFMQLQAVSLFEQSSITAEEVMLEVAFEWDESPLKADPDAGGLYTALSESEKRIYSKLYRAMWLQYPSVRVDGASSNDIFGIYDQVRFDHPELIHVGSSPTMRSVTRNTLLSHTVVTLMPEYTMDGVLTQERRAELAVAVHGMLQGVESLDDETAKAGLLHDRLCSAAEYDYVDDEADSSGHSAFGAICEGSAVCEGYALGYALICRSAGLQCETIVGRLSSVDDPTLAHAWNRVMVEGEWLYVDATFDDGKVVSNSRLLKPLSFMEMKGYLPFEDNKLPASIEPSV